ncbi:MAG: PIN domain-containing protein [Acidimicrobiales bacterium]
MSDAARHARGILDTSTEIKLCSLFDATCLPAEPLISAVTLAELSVGPHVANSDVERAARQVHLQQAESDLSKIDGLEVVSVSIP